MGGESSARRLLLKRVNWFRLVGAAIGHWTEYHHIL